MLEAGRGWFAGVAGGLAAAVAWPTQTISDWETRVPALFDKGNPELSSESLAEQLEALGYTE